MTRLPAIVCCLVGIAGLACAEAKAEPESFRIDGLPPGDALTIREAPDAGAKALDEVPVGRRLQGFGCTNDTPSGLTWCRVRTGRVVGWARRRYLTPD